MVAKLTRAYDLITTYTHEQILGVTQDKYIELKTFTDRNEYRTCEARNLVTVDIYDGKALQFQSYKYYTNNEFRSISASEWTLFNTHKTKTVFTNPLDFLSDESAQLLIELCDAKYNPVIIRKSRFENIDCD